MNPTHFPQKQLDEIYNCSICLEHLDETAISLNPCGHELHESCAVELKAAVFKCPECRVDIRDYRPAYRTQAATQFIFRKEKLPTEVQVSNPTEVQVSVKTLSGGHYKFSVDRNKKTVVLAKQISDAIKTPINQLWMNSEGCKMDFFEPLSTYLKPNQQQLEVCSTLRLGYGPYASELIFDLALESKLLTKELIDQYKEKKDFPERAKVVHIINGLEKRAIDKALEFENK